MIQSKLTSKGQTTIPIQVRRALRLKAKQRLLYRIEGRQVILKAEEEDISDLYGCLKSKKPPVSMNEMRESYRRVRIKRYKK